MNAPKTVLRESNLALSDKDSASISIFGASGDLTARKLVPALYMLWVENYLPDHLPIVGVARREKTDESFRNEMADAVRKYARVDSISDDQWAQFAKRLYYQRVDLGVESDYVGLNDRLTSIESEHGAGGKRVIYLATDPSLFSSTVGFLSKTGMVPDIDDEETLRIVFEKPFGHDLESSQALTDSLSRLLREDQIYRIDHYLGKETVQNILLFRFGNAIFEPMLNRNHVDHVQITVAEDQGIERGRGGYYDTSGALRDVLQNHVLQLLCLIAMEPPALFQAKDIRDEKLKVLKALAPGDPSRIDNWAIRGQYIKGERNGEWMNAYREEDRIPEGSQRETYVAMDVRVENWRWAGVPFYLRTGKRMPRRLTEIAVQFKLPPLHLFTTVECEGDICDLVGARPNTLVFRIQPEEGISLTCSTKRPGMQYQIHPIDLDFQYETLTHSMPEAYERLLLDVVRGDSTLFTRSDELEAAWRFVTPVLHHWENNSIEPKRYPACSAGPAEADELLNRTGRQWREL